MQALAQFVHAHHHQALDLLTETVAVCSVLHSLLPPYSWNPEFVSEGLSEFPSAQRTFHAFFDNRYYRLAIYVIGYIALNARTTVWKSLSVNNPQGVNANQATLTKTDR